MATLAPRAVIVTRETDYEALIARHATHDQARFFLQSRGQDMEFVLARHERVLAALHQVTTAIPPDWRSTRIKRGDLDRFLFGPEDIVVALGQDGLVANVAKYLKGQPVLGVNPEPAVNPGILVPLTPQAVADLLGPVGRGQAEIERRTMVQATLDDGQALLALNEIFIGHRSHQSARYHLSCGGQDEEQSSSGIIVSTGTGATGWAKSIMQSRGIAFELRPTDPAVAYFVREAWAGPSTGTSLSAGVLTANDQFEILSHMQAGGVVFADGIERDHLTFDWGKRVRIRIAEQELNLVRG